MPNIAAIEKAVDELEALYREEFRQHRTTIMAALAHGNVTALQNIIRLRPNGAVRSVQFNLFTERDLPRPSDSGTAGG